MMRTRLTGTNHTTVHTQQALCHHSLTRHCRLPSTYATTVWPTVLTDTLRTAMPTAPDPAGGRRLTAQLLLARDHLLARGGSSKDRGAKHIKTCTIGCKLKRMCTLQKPAAGSSACPKLT